MTDLVKHDSRSLDKIKGDIPISAFDPHIFQFGSLYSNLIPSSNFSIPIRVILGVGYSN
jgi:hypothetical protein